MFGVGAVLWGIAVAAVTSGAKHSMYQMGREINYLIFFSGRIILGCAEMNGAKANPFSGSWAWAGHFITSGTVQQKEEFNPRWRGDE